MGPSSSSSRSFTTVLGGSGSEKLRGSGGFLLGGGLGCAPTDGAVDIHDKLQCVIGGFGGFCGFGDGFAVDGGGGAQEKGDLPGGGQAKCGRCSCFCDWLILGIAFAVMVHLAVYHDGNISSPLQELHNSRPFSRHLSPFRVRIGILLQSADFPALKSKINLLQPLMCARLHRENVAANHYASSFSN
jgi:hypothetical protein